MELETLGKYKIESLIGTGSMGQVFRARDPILKRNVAIKTMAATAASDSQLVQRFHREAQSAARLNHPNIITVFDFGEEQGQLYMAMELLQGHDLKDLIGTSRLRSLRRKLDLLEQVLEGMGFAHAQGVIHRDIKPGNIHIQPNGRVKILDFGLARPEESEMTQAGMVMGTPNYMSPEQVRGQKAGPQSDVFSLGAVAYEVLSSRRAFRAESMHKILQRVLSEEPERLSSRVPDIPPALEQWVATAMRKNPAERFADAMEMLDALRDVRSELSPEVLDAGAPLSTGEKHAYDETVMGDSEATVLEDAATAAQRSAARTRGSTALAPAASVTRRPVQAPTLSGAAATSVGAPPHSRTAVYALGAVGFVLAVVVGALLLRGRLADQTPQGAGADLGLDAFKDVLVANEVELALLDLENKNYQSAIDAAQRALDLDPGSAEAQDVVRQAQALLDELEQVAGRARSAYESGDIPGAKRALERVMALDPHHPAVAELISPLNQYFRSEAESAQAAMERSRSAARSGDAQDAQGYSQAEALAKEGQALMAKQEFGDAAQRFMQSRDGFDSALRRAEADRRARAEAERLAQEEAEAERLRLEEERRAEERRIASSPTPAPRTPAPTPLRARETPTAAPPVTTAPSPQATPQVTARPQAAPPQPTLPPVPTLSPQEVAARGVIDDYARAYESRDMALLRTIWPSLDGNMQKQLGNYFKKVKSWDVGIDIQSVAISGQKAFVRAKRQDVLDGRQTPETDVTFNLVLAGDRWVIDSIGQ